MANFYSALEALGSGRISLESISIQLKQILVETPDYSHRLRTHLFRARKEDLISGNIFDRLNNIIEPYLLDSDEDPLGNSTLGTEIQIDIDNNFPNEELTSGKIIKHRFQLLEILGVGGMGRVYKGIDLLKQEAQDKYPYVAIKLLNEDFKHTPRHLSPCSGNPVASKNWRIPILPPYTILIAWVARERRSTSSWNCWKARHSTPLSKPVCVEWVVYPFQKQSR